MSITSGFFNALETSNGEFDRVYSSADYSDNLATIIKNGVRYSNENDLKVSASGSDMSININAGRAWINGHYVYNDIDFDELTVATAPVGVYSRIDRVVARLDTSITAREITFAIVTGQASETPVAPALTRSGDIYEIGLATILVNAGITAITNNMITDTRADNDVCGWAASVTPAVMSLLKQFVYSETLESAATTFVFDIPQFKADEPQIVDVYVNGAFKVQNVDYTRRANTITFAEEQPAGTVVTVVLKISIDGTGITSVVDEITELQNNVADIEREIDEIQQESYIYVCNGETDNVRLSEIAQEWFNGGNDNKTMLIRVVGGNIGITAAYQGDGTANNEYIWFMLGAPTNSNRRIVFDFSNAGQINVPVEGVVSFPERTTYNEIFAGFNYSVIGADVIATELEGDSTTINMFCDCEGAIYAENCRFWINTTAQSCIAKNGTFRNCRGSVSVTSAPAFCFYPSATGLIRVFGGEYYAYSNSENLSAVLNVSAADAVGIFYGVNCPSVSRAGFIQQYAVNATAGKVSITDTITILNINAPSGVVNVRGTLAVNKAGLM